MKNWSPQYRLPVLYGIYAGLLGAAVAAALYFIGIHPSLVFLVLDFRIALFAVFMVFLLRNLRETYFGGVLMMPQAVAATGLFLAAYAVVASLLIWLFGIIVPAFVMEYINLATNQLKQMPKEAIEQIGQKSYNESLARMPNTTAFDLAMLYFVQCFGLGLFISLIISVILRRQPLTQS